MKKIAFLLMSVTLILFISGCCKGKNHANATSLTDAPVVGKLAFIKVIKGEIPKDDPNYRDSRAYALYRDEEHHCTIWSDIYSHNFVVVSDYTPTFSPTAVQ